MERYLVVRKQQDAWLFIPENADSSRATWTNDRAQATAFWRPTAILWAWDMGADIELDDRAASSPA